MLALVDCNSCYASCEQIFRPDLRDKPVVVLSNNDGCIVTRNTEAKALQIPGFEPYFKLKPYLAQHGVHVFSSNYELYGDISWRIMQLLDQYCNTLEVYSIDEAFLEVTGFTDLMAHGHLIKQACWREQRMPVCVGIAQTKTLAKLANHIAKKSNKLEGVCLIDRLDDWAAVFKKIPCQAIWGIGSKLSRRLSVDGINSVYDLQQQSPKQIRRRYSVLVEHTVRELNNEPCIPLELKPPDKKEVFCSRSFSFKVTELADLRQSVASYAARACEKLRAQSSLTGCVYVNIQTSRFGEHYYNNGQHIRLVTPSNDSRLIIKVALDALASLFVPGYGYARAGVGLLDLCADSHCQDDLFERGQDAQSLKVMQTLDALNGRFGRGAVALAAQGINPTWRMSRALKSPAYSTRLSDIPVIKI